MLRKIDCVMIRVDDLEAATLYYADVFGLRPTWKDSTSRLTSLKKMESTKHEVHM